MALSYHSRCSPLLKSHNVSVFGRVTQFVILFPYSSLAHLNKCSCSISRNRFKEFSGRGRVVVDFLIEWAESVYLL